MEMHRFGDQADDAKIELDEEKLRDDVEDILRNVCQEQPMCSSEANIVQSSRVEEAVNASTNDISEQPPIGDAEEEAVPEQQLESVPLMPSFAGRYVTSMVSTHPFEVRKRFVKPKFSGILNHMRQRAYIENVVRKLSGRKELNNLLLFITPTEKQLDNHKVHCFAIDTERHIGVTSLTNEERELVERHHSHDNYSVMFCSRHIDLGDMARNTHIKTQIFNTLRDGTVATRKTWYRGQRITLSLLLRENAKEEIKEDVVIEEAVQPFTGIRSLQEPKIPVRQSHRISERQALLRRQRCSDTSYTNSSCNGNHRSKQPGDPAKRSRKYETLAHKRLRLESKRMREQHVDAERNKIAIKHRQAELQATVLDIRQKMSTRTGYSSARGSEAGTSNWLLPVAQNPKPNTTKQRHITSHTKLMGKSKSKTKKELKCNLITVRHELLRLREESDESSKPHTTEELQRMAQENAQKIRMSQRHREETRAIVKMAKQMKQQEELQLRKERQKIQEERVRVAKQKLQAKRIKEKTEQLEMQQTRFQARLDRARDEREEVKRNIRRQKMKQKMRARCHSEGSAGDQPDAPPNYQARESSRPAKNLEPRQRSQTLDNLYVNYYSSDQQQQQQQPKTVKFAEIMRNRPATQTKGVQIFSEPTESGDPSEIEGVLPGVEVGEPIEPQADEQGIKILWEPQPLHESEGHIPTPTKSGAIQFHMPKIHGKSSVSILKKSSVAFEQLLTPITPPAEYSKRACAQLQHKLRNLTVKRAFAKFGQLVECINSRPVPLNEHLMTFFQFAELLDFKIFARREVNFPGFQPTNQPRHRLECYVFEDRKEFIASIALLTSQLLKFVSLCPHMAVNLQFVEDAFALTAMPTGLTSCLKSFCVTLRAQRLYDILAELTYEWVQPPATLLTLTHKEDGAQSITQTNLPALEQSPRKCARVYFPDRTAFVNPKAPWGN